MSRLVAGFDRLVVALAGLALLLGGLAIVGWCMQIGLARTVVAHTEPRWYATAPQQDWWQWALAGATVIAAVIGVLLLLANLRPNRPGTIELETRDLPEVGTATVNAAQVAAAAAAALTDHPGVLAASGTAVVDRGRRTARITLTAAPDISLDHLRRLAAETEADIAKALDGAELDTQFFVHLAPVEHRASVRG
ncbi:MAG TPA: hypothetical protein VIW24_16270 [Aldersonia sp.]